MAPFYSPDTLLHQYLKRVKAGFLLFLICVSCSYGQQSSGSEMYRPSNTIGINIAGDAAILGLNYERHFLNKEHFYLTAKTGIGFNRKLGIFLLDQHIPDFATIPLCLSANIGSHKSFLELGIGFTLLANDKERFYVGYPVVGYRFYPLLSRKFFVRVFVELPVIAKDLTLSTYFDTYFPTVYDRITISPIGVHLGVAF